MGCRSGTSTRLQPRKTQPYLGLGASCGHGAGSEEVLELGEDLGGRMAEKATVRLKDKWFEGVSCPARPKTCLLARGLRTEHTPRRLAARL